MTGLAISKLSIMALINTKWGEMCCSDGLDGTSCII